MDQTSATVAIQGVAGSFHDEAAARHFGAGYLPVPCETFRDMFVALKRNKARYAVMAIENTVAGTSSANVFHSPQSAHCPCQRKLTPPQAWQIYRRLGLAMLTR